jgi:hypothetical protein
VSQKYAQSAQFYLLNTKQQPIKIWQGLDVNRANEDDTFDINDFNQIFLSADIIIGDVHHTLPQVYSYYLTR